MTRWHGLATLMLALQTMAAASELPEVTPGARQLTSGEVRMTQISVANSHACAVAVGGAPYCWGSGTSGSLGAGNFDIAYGPQRVIHLTNVSRISSGRFHTCAIAVNRTAHCWGNGNSGQLGTGNSGIVAAPRLVVGLQDVAQISSGGKHTCAVTANGSTYCWGEGASGQLGLGSTSNAFTPQLVSGLPRAVHIASGDDHTCAVAANGSAYCWGSGSSGELGQGSASDALTPQLVLGLSNAVQVACGVSHTCAIAANGSAYCWGAGYSGELGTGIPGEASTPRLVVGLKNATDITAGTVHTCATSADSSAYCWGAGHNGVLGSGNSNTVAAPQRVPGPKHVTHISVASVYTCAIVNNGAAYCWGYGGDGRLGFGESIDQEVYFASLVYGTAAISASLAPMHVTGNRTVLASGTAVALLRLQVGIPVQASRLLRSTIAGCASFTIPQPVIGTDFTLVCQLQANATHIDATAMTIYGAATTTITSPPIAAIQQPQCSAVALDVRIDVITGTGALALTPSDISGSSAMLSLRFSHAVPGVNESALAVTGGASYLSGPFVLVDAALHIWRAPLVLSGAPAAWSIAIAHPESLLANGTQLHNPDTVWPSIARLHVTNCSMSSNLVWPAVGDSAAIAGQDCVVMSADVVAGGAALPTGLLTMAVLGPPSLSNMSSNLLLGHNMTWLSDEQHAYSNVSGQHWRWRRGCPSSGTRVRVDLAPYQACKQPLLASGTASVSSPYLGQQFAPCPSASPSPSPAGSPSATPSLSPTPSASGFVPTSFIASSASSSSSSLWISGGVVLGLLVIVALVVALRQRADGGSTHDKPAAIPHDLDTIHVQGSNPLQVEPAAGVP